MSEFTALKALDSLHRDKMNVQISVNQILHLLHDYIPRSCIHEAEDKLFEAFFINEIELTTSNMRREYEAHKQIEIKRMGLLKWPTLS